MNAVCSLLNSRGLDAVRYARVDVEQLDVLGFWLLKNLFIRMTPSPGWRRPFELGRGLEQANTRVLQLDRENKRGVVDPILFCARERLLGIAGVQVVLSRSVRSVGLPTGEDERVQWLFKRTITMASCGPTIQAQPARDATRPFLSRHLGIEGATVFLRRCCRSGPGN